MGFLHDLIYGPAHSAVDLARDQGVPPASITQPNTVYATVPPYLDGTTAIGLNAVYRCVSLIADAIADLPWSEWRGATELPASRLVRRPFAGMTRREWTWRVVATEALYSTVYLLHVGGTDAEGAPWSLLPLPATAVTPASPLDPWAITPPRQYLVGSQLVDAEQVTIIRRAPFPGLTDGAAGVLRIARREFSGYLAADIASSRYWNAGGPVTTVITTDQELTQPEAEAIAQRWVDRRSMGADFPAVLGKGATAKPWGADPTTEASVEARREIVADIGRYFGVPTRILNAPAGDSQTYANVEQEAVDLERYTLRGYMGPIEDAISELLPGDYLAGRRMRMDTARLTQGDLASRATAYSTLVTSGIITVPEARMRGFGLPAQPAGSEPGADPMAGLPADSPADAIPASVAELVGGITNGSERP